MSQSRFIDGVEYRIKPLDNGNVEINDTIYEILNRERIIRDGELKGLIVSLRELPGGEIENILVEYHQGIYSVKHNYTSGNNN